jgi:hypothetical protein
VHGSARGDGVWSSVILCANFSTALQGRAPREEIVFILKGREEQTQVCMLEERIPKKRHGLGWNNAVSM